MRILLHGKLDPAVAAAIARHGHVPVSMSQAVLPDDLPPAELLAEAHRRQLDLLTGDRAVAQHVRTEPVRFDRSIIYLQLPGGEVEQDDAVDRLFTRYPRLKPGQIYTVTETRVKVSQVKSTPPK